ncbi:hypothetical protein, partial [Streptomyces sp. NPDC055036]
GRRRGPNGIVISVDNLTLMMIRVTVDPVDALVRREGMAHGRQDPAPSPAVVVVAITSYRFRIDASVENSTCLPYRGM